MPDTPRAPESDVVRSRGAQPAPAAPKLTRREAERVVNSPAATKEEKAAARAVLEETK